MNPDTHRPATEEEVQLLRHLAAGLPTAREEFAVRYLPLLMEYLAASFPRVDADLRHDAAGQALLDFLRRPDRFDHGRGGLGAFLRLAARGDLLNLLDRERRTRRGIPLDSVAEPADRRNSIRDDLAWDNPRLAAAVSALDPAERTALELLRDGVRDTAAFAARLGWVHLSRAEQADAVKRLKDRVKRRLVRAVEDLP